MVMNLLNIFQRHLCKTTFSRVVLRSGGVQPTLATSEKRLISTLLENYQQNGVEGRPVLDTSRPITVAVGFTPVQISEQQQQQQQLLLLLL